MANNNLNIFIIFGIQIIMQILKKSLKNTVKKLFYIVYKKITNLIIIILIIYFKRV